MGAGLGKESMSWLDDLEAQAQARRAGGESAERSREACESAYRDQLVPAMRELHEYLQRLVESLAYLKPVVKLEYPVPGYGNVPAQLAHDYELRIDSQARATEIHLKSAANVLTEDAAIISIEGAAKVRAINGAFQKVRLAGLQDFRKDDSGEMVSGQFRARGKIPLTADIRADADSGMVKMTFLNHDDWGTRARSYSAAQMDATLYDQLGRYISRQSDDLFREELSASIRHNLQQKIQQSQLRRKWEDKLAVQQREELERLRRAGNVDPMLPTTLMSRLRGLFQR